MKSKPRLDRLDLKILEALQSDGRQPVQALAERVALSASGCHSRLKRLESSGVISGYIADVRLQALGPSLITFAEVTLANHRPTDFDGFERVVADVPEIVEAYQVAGQFDYLIKVVTRDVEAYRAVTDALLAKDVGILQIKSTLVMKHAKRFAGMPLAAIADIDPR